MFAPRINLRQMPLDREVGRLLPESLAREIRGVCIGKVDTQTLSVAVVDPQLPGLAQKIEGTTPQRFRVHCVATDPESVALATEFIYATSNGTAWKTWLESQGQGAAPPLTSSAAPRDEVAQVLDRVFQEAATWKASHIHFETLTEKVRVRIRQDGMLRTYEEYPKLPLGTALIKRLKSLAGGESGRYSFATSHGSLDFGLSTVPVLGGENLLLSLLTRHHQALSLDALGLTGNNLNQMRRLLAQPYGLILMGGPRQSGKTCTLYSTLQSLQRPEKKIVSIEGSVELALDGITQVATAGGEFGAWLRLASEQDAEVVMIGELRDSESARLAVEAALSDQLVLTSVRCSSLPGAFYRLQDFAITPGRLAACLLGASLQRLVRRNCTFCQQEVQPTPEQEQLLRSQGLTRWNLRKGAGCPSCQRLGHRGRVGLFEVLSMSPDLTRGLEEGLAPGALHRMALAQDMTSLLQDGLGKAASGLVPLEEIQRVCLTHG